jgi:hypothetical protein
MPAGAKMSMASMKAEPMMPNMSVTPLATMVSTKASEGVMRVGPVGHGAVVRALMAGSSMGFEKNRDETFRPADIRGHFRASFGDVKKK